MDTILSILNQSIREAANPTTAGVIIAVIGLNIHFGFTGLLNIGQGGFMLLGAYGFAISIWKYDLPLPVAILIGLGAAFLFALVLGAPTLQLRGDYLAIVTISAAEIIRFTGRLSGLKDFTGGALGIRGSKYQDPFLDQSFLPTTNYTLWPFNYTDVAGGATWVRSVGLLAFLLIVVGVFLLLRRTTRIEGPAGAVVDVALLPATALLAALMFVFALIAVSTNSGHWRWILVLLGLVAVATFVFTLLRVLRAKPPGELVGTVLGAVGLSILGFGVLFFVFPLGYATNFSNGWWTRMIGWGMVLTCTILVTLLVRSPWGRLLRGIREDEDAIRSLGKNVYAVKMQALIIGGFFGALGGMVYVLALSVQPDSLGRQLTFFAFTALLLGGAATIFGPILGGIIFFASRVLIKEVANAYVPDSIMSNSQTDQFSYIVVGVALMLLVIFRPQGILGDKRELRINV